MSKSAETLENKGFVSNHFFKGKTTIYIKKNLSLQSFLKISKQILKFQYHGSHQICS